MSFEGYYQMLCANGHYITVDVYEDTPKKCAECGTGFVWVNTVDETNGDSVGYVHLQVEVAPKSCVCPTCGDAHSEPTRYKIPRSEKH